MLQSIRSVVVELQPESVPQLRAQIERMKQAQEGLPVPYAALKDALPLLHFMSATIFLDDQYDPVLVIEVNFDGAPGPFWAQFEQAFGDELRAMLRCGKVPRDGRGPLFAAVIREGSRAPIAPLMEALTIPPAVGHQGNRNLDRSRIEGEGLLFHAVQDAIDRGGMPAAAAAIHASLREKMLPQFRWLDATAPRFTATEITADWLRLLGFAALLLLALMLPGALMSLVLPPWDALIVLLALGVVFARGLGTAKPPPGAVKVKWVVAGGGVLVAVAAAVALAGAFLASLFHGTFEHFGGCVWRCAIAAGIGLAGLFPVIGGLLAAIRALEMRDAPQDAPRLDAATMRAMAVREDQIAQNHMGSIVHIKPGILRAIVLRVVMRTLGLALRATARDGYLGSMRTIHFAHWAIISNGSRLLFFSNFDGSWESYLDDFIEKAHAGLTLAWTTGVGFPPTRFLILDGATQGRKFKAWARRSMAESLFWYSAYKDFTVNQIERQARIADGLRRPSLSHQEAERWALDL